MSLWAAVEPVAMAICATAVSDGVEVTFCRATAPRLGLASPPFGGSTPLLKYFWIRSGLAPSSEIRTAFGDAAARRGGLSSSFASVGTIVVAMNIGAATAVAHTKFRNPFAVLDI